MVRQRFVVAGVVVGLLGGCAAREVKPGGEPEAQDLNLTPAAEYYPLAEGSRWSYQVGEPDGQEVLIELTGRSDGYFVDQRGGRLRADAFGIRDEKRYLLRDPVKPGTTWTNVVAVSAAEHYRILSALAPCEVPAGRFEDCAQVESRVRVNEGVTLVNTMTFARGVGLVRVQVVAETPKGLLPQTGLELARYSLAGDAAP